MTRLILFLCLAVWASAETNTTPHAFLTFIPKYHGPIISCKSTYKDWETNNFIIQNFKVIDDAYTTRELVTNKTEYLYGACEPVCFIGHTKHEPLNRKKKVDYALVERTILQIKWRDHVAITNDRTVTNWSTTQTLTEEWR